MYLRFKTRMHYQKFSEADHQMLAKGKKFVNDLLVVTKEALKEYLHKHPNLRDAEKLDEFADKWYDCLESFKECLLRSERRGERDSHRWSDALHGVLFLLKDCQVQDHFTEKDFNNALARIRTFKYSNFETKNFLNRCIITEEQQKKLEKYIETAKIIRSSPGFAESTAKKLEDFILDREKVLDDSMRAASIEASKYCINLSVPRLGGKAQLAFLFDQVKPLYFEALQGSFGPDYSRVQASDPVVACFKSLSTELGNIVWTDVSANDFNDEDVTGALKDTLYYTLGFLGKLVEIAADKPDDVPWMQFLADIEEFQFHSASIDEVKGKFKGFALFLEGSFDLTNKNSCFLLNLAQRIDLPLVYVESSPDLSRILESMTPLRAQKSAWSMIVTKLDPPCLEVLEKQFGLSTSVRKLLEGRGADDAVRKFFTDFNIQDLRPGVARFTARALETYAKTLPDGDNFSLGQLLDFIAKAITEKLILIKPDFEKSKEANAGNFCLLSRLAYTDYNQGTIFHRPFNDLSHSVDHLFCRWNPVDASKNFFLTFPPDPSSQSYPISRFKFQLLQLYKNNSFSTGWHELSVFDPKEFILMLSCLIIPYRDTVASICHDSSLDTRRRCIFTSFDHASSVPLDAYHIQLVLTRASHYTIADAQSAFSFKGPKGNEYIKNVLFELMITQYSSKPRRDFQLSLPEELNLLLENIRVPFLYRIGDGEMSFEKYSSLVTGFFVSRLIQSTPILDLAEVHFTAMNQATYQVLRIALETKSTRGCVTCKDLLRVMRNVSTNRPDVIFIYCNMLPIAIIEESDLMKYCQDNKINVYRTKMGELHKSYSIVPFYFSCENPRMICIALENFHINS